MRIEVIFCPACRNKLRISEDLLGTPVQCPKCGAEFVGPPPPPDRSPDPRPLPDQRDWGEDRWESRPPRDVSLKVMPVALAMVAAGFGNLMLNLLAVYQAATQPDEMRREIQAFMPAGPMPFDIIPVMLVSGIAFAVISVLQMLGGFAMFGRRSYTMSVLGALISLINCNQICCLLSIPVGVWALIVLFMPDVRENYR